MAHLPAICIEESAPAKPPKRRRPYKHAHAKPRPFTREQLDQRTVAFKVFENLVANVIQDAGGESEISAVMRELIEAFAGVAIRVRDLNTRGLAGQPVDLSELSLAASTLTRLASRIGTRRVPREVPDLQQYLAQLKPQDAAE
jgi:hypothetical protein